MQRETVTRPTPCHEAAAVLGRRDSVGGNLRVTSGDHAIIASGFGFDNRNEIRGCYVQPSLSIASQSSRSLQYSLMGIRTHLSLAIHHRYFASLTNHIQSTVGTHYWVRQASRTERNIHLPFFQQLNMCNAVVSN